MLELDGLNYWAIAVTWLINCAVGAWWYSPAAFGPLWGKLAGNDIMKIPEKEATRIIGFVMLSAVLQAFVLAIILNTIGATTLLDGLLAGAVLWLGLTAATTVGVTLYSRRNWKFWWLNSSYFLLVMTVNSVILATWQ
jgi:hypothetical protein